jgi:type VI protein secretion system component Hcp
MSLFAQLGVPDVRNDYIEGPCQVAPHVKWFEPSSLSLDHPSPRPINNDARKAPDQNQIRAVWLTLPLDVKTPLLYQANAHGTVFKNVLIEVLVEHKGPLQLKLTDVMITDVQMSDSNVVIKFEFTGSNSTTKRLLDKPSLNQLTAEGGTRSATVGSETVLPPTQ